ncbi:MAG: lasso peptide biosynthesis B2 protein [Alphaproteobacteria bacterium]|nr:lasso peptide biosynthesis B2 protein [Alphaproteobacteria bacterium]
MLIMASAAIALLPFRYAIRLGSVPLGKERISMADCLWAIEAVSRRLPWPTACIEKGLVAQRLLRGSGLDALLHYGARQEANELEAHVWVTVDGQAVIGGEEAKSFAAIAVYP